MDFININQQIDFDVNFWELNPQIIYMTPYNELHALDKGGGVSSKMMWTIVAKKYPDETLNKFYRFGEKEIREMLSETFLKEIDNFWEDELYKKCLEAFPNHCLNSVQRSLLDIKEFLTRRGRFLKTADYNLETMSKIDMAVSKNDKIYTDFERIEEKFLKSQHNTRIKGGRKQSKAEKREI